MAKLLLTIVFGALVASTSGNPRLLKLWPSRIVGGEEADSNSTFYQVSLRYFGSHTCGGSIINEYWIATAAHCVDGKLSLMLFSILAGSHDIQKPESTAQTCQVSKIVVHENYNSKTIINDIALLKLSKPLILGVDRRACAIPLANHSVQVGTPATITGWGTTSAGGTGPAALRTVTVPIISDSKCREAYGSDTIVDTMICAGLEEGGKDSCQGDSGGPLVVDHEGTTVLAGIVSWGNGCAQPGWPGVYTEVSCFVDWVKKQLDQP